MPLRAKIFLKISPYAENHEDYHRLKKGCHPPFKKFIIEKNDLLIIQVSQRCQTNPWSETHLFLSISAKGTFGNKRSDEKVKKNWKKNEKKVGPRVGFEPGTQDLQF